MSRKKYTPIFFSISAALLLLFTYFTITPTLPKEVPVTTSSKQALQYFMQGRDKLANVQMPEAAALFDKAIQEDQNFALAYLYRALSSDNFNESRQYLQKAIDHSGQVSAGEKLVIRYVEAQFDGNTVKQKQYIGQLLSNYADDKWVQQTAGQYYYGHGKYQKALAHFMETTKLDKNFAPPYNMIGYTQSQLGNYEAAEKAFKTYIDMIPNNPNPYDSYAELLLKMGKYDQSIAQYQKALSIDPSFVSSLQGIGNNYIFKGDYTNAREYYDKEYQMAPTVGQKLSALYWKAISYVHEGNIPQAVEVLSQERELAQKHNLIPNVIGTYESAGLILTHTGNIQDGMEHLDKASSLIESSSLPAPVKERARVMNSMEKCYNTTMAGKFSDAEQEAAKTKVLIDQRKNPNELKLWNFVMGVVELKKDNNPKALAYLSKADDENPSTWYFKANAYENMGDKQKSASLYKKVSTWNVNSIDLALVRNDAIKRLNGISVSSAK